MAKLVAQSGPTAGKEYPITKELMLLGRQSTCDVQVIDNAASRAHAQVRKDGRFFTLVDLGSRNGTAHNGNKVSERQLNFGDRIRIGEVELVLVKEADDVEIKDLLGKYEIGEKIGEGGMGIVFKAVQVSMARTIALKILAPKYATKPRFVAQFIREARAAGALNHQNIIQVHDVATENEVHYFSMEYVDGPTCMQVLRENGPFECEEALEIIRQTAKALEYAHSHRLIHQDIKPDNIMVGSDNVVKLADLGISKTFEEAEVEGSDEGRRVMGTPHYMAPEAALGKKIDHRVDLYSLGATCYHLLTGKTPFHGTNPTEVLKAQVMEQPRPIRDLNPKITQPIALLVERLLAKNPDDRFQTAAEVQEAINAILGGKGGGSSDRISQNGDTVILRRYVAGAQRTPGADVDNTPAHTTNGTNARTADSLPAAKQMRLATMILFGSIAILVVVVLAAALAAVFKAQKATDQPGTPPKPATNVAGPLPEGAPSNSPIVDPAKLASAQALTALTELDRILAKPTDQIDLQATAAQLALVPSEGLNSELGERRKLAAARLEAVTQRRQTADLEAAYATLDNEVRTLVSERNFDIALQRLDAFKHKDAALLAARIVERRTSITKDKTDFVADLEGRIKLAVTRKDLDALKSLREKLPQPWLDSTQAQAIQAAIKELEAARSGRFDQVVVAANKALATWNLDEVDKIHAANRPAAEGTPAAGRLDANRDTAKGLRDLVKALSAKIKILRQVRYPGLLGGFDKPDIMDINAEQGVELKDSRGGTAFLAWNRIKPADLTGVVQAVLGTKESEPFQAAITALAQAQEQAKEQTKGAGK